ncbi:MAG: Gfo/Idh/MocA family oxidoreductase [Clostridia bacterium]|nr:Gfo/Idh/MocA family oxidoreductase [Clostridia bacterium]
MFKICVIGCGSMSNSVHGPSFARYANENTETELSGCCDVNEDAARNYAEKYGFKRYYTDMDIMLENENPDAVSVIVPVHLTREISIRVMTLGYAVILEKPPGLNERECLDMIEAADKHHSKTMVAFNRRYSPLITMFKEKLAQCPYPLDYIKCDFYRNQRKDKDFSTTCIHGIDAVRNIIGSDYKHIDFSYQPLLNAPVGNIYLKCQFENGVVAHLNFIPCVGKSQEEYLVNAYDNTFILKHAVGNDLETSGRITHYDNAVKLFDKTGIQLGIPNENFICAGFYDENRHFFDCLRNNTDIHGDIKDGLQSVIIADCIRNKVTSYSF